MLKEYQYTAWHYALENSWPIAPFCVENVVIEGVRKFNETTMSYLICALIHSGNITYQHGNQKYELSAGDIMLIPPNTPYSFFSNTGYKKQVIEIQGICIVSVLAALGMNSPIAFHPGEIQTLSEEIDKIETYLSAKSLQDLPILAGRSYALLHHLSQLLESREKPEDNLVSQAVNLLESSADGIMSISEVAKKLSLNERALQRMICKSYGASPKKLQNQSRLGKAQQLLQYTELSIKEIAFHLGYCNPNYFSSEFRRLTGLSPKEYRNRLHDGSQS